MGRWRQEALRQVTLVDHGNLLAVPVRIMLVSGGEAAIEPSVRRSPPAARSRSPPRPAKLRRPHAHLDCSADDRRRPRREPHEDLCDERLAISLALDGVSTSLEPGEFVAVMGPSGSGKSTFMNIIGFLDRPTSGDYFFEGRDVRDFNSDQLADMRSRKLGFVFQSYNLLPRTNALENVELPLIYAGMRRVAAARGSARPRMRTVGIEEVASHMPNQLSGGQQQRIAIARALVNNPSLILADEPTGALDTKTSQDVMRLITRLNLEQGITILVVTHERDIAAYARRIITFRDGKIESDCPARRPKERRREATQPPSGSLCGRWRATSRGRS